MKPIATIAALTLATGLFAQSGEALFDAKCAVCHLKTRPTPQTRADMLAPPAMGVMFHVKEAIADRAEAIAFIKDYVVNPDASKAKCLPQSIQRFGVMPSQKGLLSEAELSAVAEYLYDNFPPQGFRHGPGPR